MTMPSSLAPLVPRLVSRRCGVVTDLRRIHKDPAEPELPFIYRAELANHGFLPDAHYKPMVGSGKGFSEDAAITGALGEAVERYAASLWNPRQVQRARRSDLPGASLDPVDLVLYAPHQYAELRYAPWDADHPIGWVCGRSWGSDEPIWLPSLAVHLNHEAADAGEFICPVTSNGLACGGSAEHALLKAALELIERDAFMLMWLLQVPPQPLSTDGLPDAQLQDLMTAYARRGVHFELYRLRHGLALPVVMALGLDDSGHGPAVVVGLGAALDLTQAARSAILEVAQVRPALRIRMRSPEARQRIDALLADPMAVDDLEDHDLLYAAPAMLPHFDFVRRQPVSATDWPVPAAADPAVELARLGQMLADAGLPLHHVDLTPADMQSLGLHVTRALIPGLQPIHFGAREIRLGGRRLYAVGARLLGRERLDWHDVNPMPHPLS